MRLAVGLLFAVLLCSAMCQKSQLSSETPIEIVEDIIKKVIQ